MWDYRFTGKRVRGFGFTRGFLGPTAGVWFTGERVTRARLIGFAWSFVISGIFSGHGVSIWVGVGLAGVVRVGRRVAKRLRVV